MSAASRTVGNDIVAAARDAHLTRVRQFLARTAPFGLVIAERHVAAVAGGKKVSARIDERAVLDEDVVQRILGRRQRTSDVFYFLPTSLAKVE